MTTLPQWRLATWDDYVVIRDHDESERIKVFYHQGYLFAEMGAEGIDHARFCDLLVMIFAFWFARQPELTFDSLGRCQLEKIGYAAAAPDQVLYIGGNVPKRQAGERRFINLDKWRVPDLVGEVADTTLASDLDEKKQLYAALGIPEYWVIDVTALRVLAFRLNENQRYQQVETSTALAGLPISLLDATFAQIKHGNGSAAAWFVKQLVDLSR
ncbi:MAG: Uma2 family endonuclease [Cyanobacteria bacterium J06635_1]